MKHTFQITLSLLLAALAFSSPSVLAVESTPSASPDIVTENLKERLIETINQVSGNTEAKRSVGYIGKVKDIVQNTIVVEDKAGKINVLVSADSEIVRSPGNTKIKLENVNIGDGIIAIGRPAEEDSELNGQRIIVSSQEFTPPKKTSGLAKITKLTSSSLTLSPLGSDTPIVLDLSVKTAYKNSESALELDDLSVGDTVIYSALVDTQDPTDLTATVLMQIKSEAPEPSPSPSAKASPKPSPKPSPKD